MFIKAVLKLKADPERGDKTAGRWQSCSFRPPGATVNTAEFHQKRFATQVFSEETNIESRKPRVRLALHLPAGFTAFKTSNSEKDVDDVREKVAKVTHCSGIGVRYVLTLRARADMCYGAERQARARCVYEQTLQARTLVCPGRVPGAHTHLAHVLGALWPPVSGLAPSQKHFPSLLRICFV